MLGPRIRLAAKCQQGQVCGPFSMCFVYVFAWNVNFGCPSCWPLDSIWVSHSKNSRCRSKHNWCAYVLAIANLLYAPRSLSVSGRALFIFANALKCSWQLFVVCWSFICLTSSFVWASINCQLLIWAGRQQEVLTKWENTVLLWQRTLMLSSSTQLTPHLSCSVIVTLPLWLMLLIYIRTHKSRRQVWVLRAFNLHFNFNSSIY